MDPPTRVYKNGFRNLIAWQEAKKLALKIYTITDQFPKSELFALTSQLRRASTSIAANIAEGSAMPSKAHRNGYYSRAKGSAVEVDNFADFVCALGYISQDCCSDLIDHCARVSYLITRLIQSA